MATNDKDEDPLFVDLSGTSRAKKSMRKRAAYTEYDNVDLSSGYPREQIWTTKDGRRIAVPNMSDKHLLNTIAYLRRRTEDYRKMLIAQVAKQVHGITLVNMLFDTSQDPSWERAAELKLEELSSEGRRLFHLNGELLLGSYIPQYRYMLREAYKRKILLEVDDTKIEHFKDVMKEAADHENELARIASGRDEWGDS